MGKGGRGQQRRHAGGEILMTVERSAAVHELRAGGFARCSARGRSERFGILACEPAGCNAAGPSCEVARLTKFCATLVMTPLGCVVAKAAPPQSKVAAVANPVLVSLGLGEAPDARPDARCWRAIYG